MGTTRTRPVRRREQQGAPTSWRIPGSRRRNVEGPGGDGDQRPPKSAPTGKSTRNPKAPRERQQRHGKRPALGPCCGREPIGRGPSLVEWGQALIGRWFWTPKCRSIYGQILIAQRPRRRLVANEVGRRLPPSGPFRLCLLSSTMSSLARGEPSRVRLLTPRARPAHAFAGWPLMRAFGRYSTPPAALLTDGLRVTASSARGLHSAYRC